tara:strand:- start:349 stop:537 length:189 start_codon:yes stop_codon:yes gene_type:complete
MEALQVKRLKNPNINNITMDGCRELFMEYYSDLDGVALKNNSETIENVVLLHRSRKNMIIRK